MKRLALVALALLAGCGDRGDGPPTTHERPAADDRAAQSRPPRYEPPTTHRRRPRGAVYGDEIGAPIVGSSYRSVLDAFGPPFARDRRDGRRCMYYRRVGSPTRFWELCFARGAIVSAYGNRRLPRSAVRT